MENFGIKIGTDVDNDSDIDLNLTSKYGSLKLYKWGDAQFTTNGSGIGSVQIPHDLDYAPMVMIFRKTTAQYTFLSATTYPNSYMAEGSYNSYAGSDFNNVSVVESDVDNITISNFPAIGYPLGGGNAPNTTYYFRYLIFVDQSQTFSDKSNIALTGDYGMKVSKPGKNVLTAEEYEMNLSSKYKSIQFYDNHILSSSLTLPAMWATGADPTAEMATYVDFNHSLGYAPHFFLFTDYGGSNWYQIPVLETFDTSGSTISGISEVSGWSDASRVRALFKRKSFWTNTLDGHVFAETTINFKCIIFVENLAETAN